MKTIYDPLYGYIEFEDYLVNIIDTLEFQRLRDIKQLGCAFYVFPSATHTRFEHSLGVSYLAGIFINSIKENQPELEITNDDIRHIKIAGLIHDLGHACYSHFFDNHFLKELDNPLREHEERSIYMLEYMNHKYKLDLNDEDINEIEKIIIHNDIPKFKYQIISNLKSGYDCDKLDYINRDCYHLGLPYKYDYTRILKQIKIIDNEICFPIKQLANVYELFELRYKLHQQIYQHPIIGCVEMMILDMFNCSMLREKREEYLHDVSKFSSLTDNYIDFLYWTEKENEKLQTIYGNLKSRKLYKFIQDSEDPDLKIEYSHVIKIKINFGMGDKNPLSNMKFYDKNGLVEVDLDKYLLVVPNKYEVVKYRYVKVNDC
jgi:HD superfamily phosphohydrolase